MRHIVVHSPDQAGEAHFVVTPWNPPRRTHANRWYVWRVFVALHVYVHLILLGTVAAERAPDLEAAYGPMTGMTGAQTARGRARYLDRQLRAVCWHNLGPGGKAMADWLHSLLERLDPTPPPEGANVHLYLDLYRSDTARLEKMLQRAVDCRGDLRRDLTPSASEDVSRADAILCRVSANDAVKRLRDYVGRFDPAELGVHYPEIRREIAACLLDAAVGRMERFAEHDGEVERLVAGSSDALFAVFDRGEP